MQDARIYLDHNATTPVDPQVIDAIARCLRETSGNASSVHEDGRAARALVDEARAAVAALIGAQPADLVFTSCATEANNAALRGMVEWLRRAHGDAMVLTTPVEHPSVLGPVAWLASHGVEVRTAPVDSLGRLDPDAVTRLLTPGRPTVVSVMLANNETGNVYPVGDIAGAAHEAGAIVHVDAVQAAGKLPLDVATLGADLLTLSAHKLHGPKGVGALWVRRGLKPAPLLLGGHQERGRRGGTENVPGIVGFGVAARVAARAAAEPARIAALRDRLWRGLEAMGAHRNGDPERCLPNTLNVSVDGTEGEVVLASLDLAGVSVSSGSACTAGSLEPSHVLLAMGLSRERARAAVRFSLGRGTTAEEIDRVLSLLPDIVARTRGLSPRRNQSP
ncbi:MAG: cysteine desulfurase [Myxococcales bacterium]